MMNADTLLDRYYLKTQIGRWRLAAILLAVLALLALLHPFSSHPAIEGDYIARLEVEDVILDDVKRDELIQEVIDNPRIKALVVRLNTPGGSVVGGQELYLQLRRVAEHKPVVAVMRTLCASAGYMVALGADRIFARESTMTGSIGVLMETAEATRLIDKIGVTPIIIKSSPLKASPSPLEKLTPDAERMIRNVIDDTYALFVDLVAQRRQLPRDQVLRLADGRIYTGRQALANKLIDALGAEEEAQAWLEKEKHVKAGLNIKEIKIKEEGGMMEEFFHTMAEKIYPQSLAGLDGLVSIWHPKPF